MISSKQAPIVTALSLAVLAVMVLTLSVSVLVFKVKKYDSYDKKDFIDSSTYQAVFMDNDQVYFGRLKSINRDYLILSEVYYVKVNEDGDNQIIKLGVIEPHGPYDKMIINKDQVLYWENLKPSSQVIETIKKLQTQ